MAQIANYLWSIYFEAQFDIWALFFPGRGNAFLINTRQSLALLYNDQSVLENHHVALAFQLTLQQSNNVNIFARLSRDEFVAIRQAVVDMVLATDMCRHFEYLTKFQQTITNLHVRHYILSIMWHEYIVAEIILSEKWTKTSPHLKPSIHCMLSAAVHCNGLSEKFLVG